MLPVSEMDVEPAALVIGYVLLGIILQACGAPLVVAWAWPALAGGLSLGWLLIVGALLAIAEKVQGNK